MKFKNYEESDYSLNLIFAKHLVLFACFIFYAKWVS